MLFPMTNVLCFRIIIIIIIIIVVINNNRSNWNHFRILQKTLEQHTRKARSQGTTAKSYSGHSTHTAESANVEARKSLILKTALYAPLTVRAE
jgi:hypothetical protein